MDLDDFGELNELDDIDGLNVYDAFNALVTERRLYELIVYDYYISPLIPDDFWEPVTVSLSTLEIEKLPLINITEECLICCEVKNIFKGLSCCNNKICKECTLNWFSCSVKCPFCIRDRR